MNGRKSVQMRLGVRVIAVLAGIVLASSTVWAQTESADDPDSNPAAPAATERAKPQPIVLSNFNPHDARALNQFEAPKRDIPYEGFKLVWGAAFTQQFQSLRHENTAAPNVVAGVDVNRLVKIGSGFNNADANLYMDAQLGQGIRVALTSYLSSRHHSETWVKDGYLLIDGSPWENETLDNMFKYLTLKVGHFEINYGDQHFRRTDNGQAMFNPFVGNLLMDAFTTEIGGEAYVRANHFLGMVAMTGGEVRGQVIKPEQRSPSVMAKVGYDRQFTPDARVRLTGSFYNTEKSISNTLYTGSRAGSRYYYVAENVNATEGAQAWSGDVRPGFSRKVQAWVVNPFVKFHDLELFGQVEQAKGRTLAESEERTWNHLAAEGVYRLFANHVYVAGRWNQAKGDLSGIANEVTVDRIQVGGGWFLSPNMLAKIEYVEQKYKDFPVTDLRNGAKFNGAVFEAVVSF